MFSFLKKSKIKKNLIASIASDDVNALSRMLNENDPEFPISITDTLVRLSSNDRSDIDATLLTTAAAANAIACSSYLIHEGAPINQKLDVSGGTAIIVAAEQGCNEVLDLFIENGGSVDEITAEGETALMLASANRHQECVKTLIDAGASVDIADANNQTALHMAVLGDNVGIVRVLLKAGSDVNSRNINGATPLIGAAETGNARIARSLIEAGADKNIKNNNGATALDIARSWDHLKVICLLA